MEIIERGILNRGQASTARAVSTCPALTSLPDGTLLATYRVGSEKDTADGTVEFRRSQDGGRSWSEPVAPLERTVNGIQGSVSVAQITPLSDQHLIMSALWVDRETYPRKPLFNEQTEGCLPMQVLLADSTDMGHTWSPWRILPCPEELGPPSITNPILNLSSGRLAVSIETNKTYEDSSRWFQRVVYLFSDDLGQNWSDPHTVSQDPSGRIFNWDQRTAVDPQGRLFSFTWTFDQETAKYLNIHRRQSNDEGQTWSAPEDLGFADQPSVPAVLPDGRFVLAWVDRFGSRTIRARLAGSGDAVFEEESEVVLYEHDPPTTEFRSDHTDTGELLGQMGVWNFGLPYVHALPDDNVMVVYYEGDKDVMQISWVRIAC